jgi:hypothetical protein
VKTSANKRLFIFKSHSDLNRCTPCMGKPNQYDTYASHASPRMPAICFLWAVPVCGNLAWVIDRFGQIPLLWRKRAPDTIHRLTDPWVRTQFLSQANQWSSRLKPSFCWWQATRITGPISPSCDRYVQYLLAGANPSVFNRHRWGL